MSSQHAHDRAPPRGNFVPREAEEEDRDERSDVDCTMSGATTAGAATANATANATVTITTTFLPRHLIDDDNTTSRGDNDRHCDDNNGRNSNDFTASAANRHRTHHAAAATTTGRRTRRTSAIDRARYSRPGRPKHAAFLELLCGTSLYLACILLPSLPGYAYGLYRLLRRCSAYANVVRERVLWCIWITCRFVSLVVFDRQRWWVRCWDRACGWATSIAVAACAGDDDGRPSFLGRLLFLARGSDRGNDGGRRSTTRYPRLGRRVRNYIFSTSTASLWEEFNQRERRQRRQQDAAIVDPWGLLFGRTMSTTITLVTLTALLAIVRVWFVHMLVPECLADPRRLEAMTRCKSSHMLSSSSYAFGGNGGMAGGADDRGSIDGVVEGGDNGMRSGWHDRISMWVSHHWHRLRPSVRRALGHEPTSRYNDILVADRRQQQLQQHHQPPSPASPPLRRSNSTPASLTQQLFLAPRHATATFRLFYTSISCVSALALFQSADFWPRPVFGRHPHASTRHCWDLSGSFILLDDDYDAGNNRALRYFFLAQAAFQLHSLCFHIVSMLLLLLYGGVGSATVDGGDETGGVVGGNDAIGRPRGGDKRMMQQQQHRRNSFQQQRQPRTQRLVSMKTSMQSYFRPMMEHVIVLALLIGAYLFSGLRRLGAVGIFTLELSSCTLQLLQVCIYAPERSILRKPEVVLFVHRMVTIPTFVYCRLFILPFVIWRSALFESRGWLEQIEKVFSPLWAERLYAMFNGSLCLIFVLNLVLFRRLLFHPHLRQIGVGRRRQQM